MRIAELLERRREGWIELEKMCDLLNESRFPYGKQGAKIARFSALYRAACTDLSMAEQYQLPPATVEYLHRLVGRAHSQLYRSHRFPVERWLRYLTTVIPHAVFRDPCVTIAGAIFFGTFAASALLAFSESMFPAFATHVLGQDQIEALEDMYSRPLGQNHMFYLKHSADYIKHNAGIGLQCYSLGPLLLPSLCMLAYNGTVLGASFGYMARPDVTQGENFFQFVTAHGAFELTAIALAAASGLRIGLGWFSTHGFTRWDSFRLNAERSMPIMIASVLLFVLAAFTEGCLSPSGVPYLAKTIFAIGSSTSLMLYFVLLGYPTPERLAALEKNEDNPWREVNNATR